MANTQRYGQYVTRKDNRVTAHFDMTEDHLQLSDNFAWLFHALEDARDNYGWTIYNYQTSHDAIKGLIASALDLFLHDTNSTRRLRNADDFCEEFKFFVYEMATGNSHRNLAAMTPDEFRTARKQLRLTQRQLANALNLGKDGTRAVQRWEAGDRPISGPVQVAVKLMLDATGCESTRSTQ